MRAWPSPHRKTRQLQRRTPSGGVAYAAGVDAARMMLDPTLEWPPILLAGR